MLSKITYNNLGMYKSSYDKFPPFPHIVMDNFLQPEFIKALNEETRNLSQTKSEWWRFNLYDEHNDQIQKNYISDYQKLPTLSKLAVDYFNGPEFIKILEGITGFKNLKSDPTLTGGGYHQTGQSGKLNIHHDFTKHFINGELVYRHINLLIYLNDIWDNENWNGQLELWSKDLKNCERVVDIVQNRAVIFTIDGAPHGHPHPLQCPSHIFRRSLAFYYYNTDNPEYYFDRAHWKIGEELK
jgi:Rps23 Pro-64 3,4-dihydroxylase Tpa1-like proline 4-hydroxylase